MIGGLSALAVSLLGACVPDDPSAGARDQAQAPPPAAVPQLHYLGPITLSDAAHDDTLHRRRAAGLAPAAVTPAAPDARLARFDGRTAGEFGVIHVDFAARAEYLATYDSGEVEAAAARLLELGYHEGSGAGAALAAPRGWSHDVDNRISFQGYSDTHPVLRMVGQVGGGCTGALFGNRLVLTAAHCIFDADGNYYANNSFAPRRDGAELPYGKVVSQGALYPIAFKNDGCHTAYTGACVRNDWAILILPPNPWASSPNGAPGYFGVWWAGDATVAGFNTRNIGYPACGEALSPTPCGSGVAYGDLVCAGVAPRFSSPDSRWPLYGTNGKMDTGCDSSAGHSGGPIYSTSPGTNGPYIIGNTVWNQCNDATCAATTEYASAGIRISETLAGYMMNLRATYP